MMGPTRSSEPVTATHMVNLCSAWRLMDHTSGQSTQLSKLLLKTQQYRRGSVSLKRTPNENVCFDIKGRLLALLCHLAGVQCSATKVQCGHLKVDMVTIN